MLVFISNSLFFPEGSQVEFRMESLQVVEGEDTVAVCVLLLGNQLSADGQVRVTTESGTALGELYIVCELHEWFHPFLNHVMMQAFSMNTLRYHSYTYSRHKSCHVYLKYCTIVSYSSTLCSES